MNNAPIDWLYKKQATIETSVFGAIFFCDEDWIGNTPGIAKQAAHDESDNLRIIVDLWDNMSVIYNTQRPDSTLKKKLNSIC